MIDRRAECPLDVRAGCNQRRRYRAARHAAASRGLLSQLVLSTELGRSKHAVDPNEPAADTKLYCIGRPPRPTPNS